MPSDPNQPYDMKEVVDRIVDSGSFLELMPEFAKNIVIGFSRVEGRTVGVVANQPKELAGCLDIDASVKVVPNPLPSPLPRICKSTLFQCASLIPTFLPSGLPPYHVCTGTHTHTRTHAYKSIYYMYIYIYKWAPGHAAAPIKLYVYLYVIYI